MSFTGWINRFLQCRNSTEFFASLLIVHSYFSLPKSVPSMTLHAGSREDPLTSTQLPKCPHDPSMFCCASPIGLGPVHMTTSSDQARACSTGCSGLDCFSRLTNQCCVANQGLRRIDGNPDGVFSKDADKTSTAPTPAKSPQVHFQCPKFHHWKFMSLS